MHQATRTNLLTTRAHGLRQCATETEEMLWRELRASQLGVRLRRQVVLLGRFIVDFYAPSARLVVEVDGPYHQRCRAADARRQRALMRAGYRVLRVEAERVWSDLRGVLELIASAVNCR
jgi:very-short-patch-repair endonuclease